MAKLSKRVVKYEVPHNHLPADMKPSEVEENNSRYSLPEGYRWDLKDMSYYEYKMAAWSDKDLIELGYLTPHITKPEQIEELRTHTKGETNMTNTLRTLNLTLLDLSPELKGDDKVVYEEQGIRTEYNDDQTIQNLLATGDVLSALEIHNDNIRVKTLDHQYKGSAREVFLEAIDHLGDNRLKWEVVRVG